MRIVLDLQECQTGLAADEAVGRYLQSLAKALAEKSKEHEVWIALNAQFGSAVERLRGAFSAVVPPERIVIWHPASSVRGEISDQVSQLLREAFFASLVPDVIVAGSLCSQSVVASAGAFDRRTPVVAVVDDAESASRVASIIKRAQGWLATSEKAREEAIRFLGLPAGSVLLVPAESILANIDSVLASFECLRATHKGDSPKTVPSSESKMPRLAYVSPFPPLRTGIADYSAELLPELSRYYEIEVIADQPEISDSWILANLTIRDCQWFDANAFGYDRILYHIGNGPAHKAMFDLLERHPGVVVLHDFYLSHVHGFLENSKQKPDAWTSTLYASHGYPALLERATLKNNEAIVWKYPCNWPVLAAAEGIITHSDYSRRQSAEWYPGRGPEQWTQIPLLRTPALPQVPSDRDSLRRSLGFENDDFVICSFGELGPTKLNSRLLAAWLESPLASDPRCKLVFVGTVFDNAYAHAIQKTIAQHSAGKRVRLTGFVDASVYNNYLRAADGAVQLRSRSRGESSASVLDCMNHGLPTITNSNGSFAELPEEWVIKLADEFQDSDLVAALRQLRENSEMRQALGNGAQRYIQTVHNPARVASQYFDAIEKFSTNSWQFAQRQLIQSISKLCDRATEEPPSKTALADAIAKNQCNSNKPARQLFVDVSVVATHDLRTGIERVVRSILWEFLVEPPQGFRIEPVYLDRSGLYRYARRFTQRVVGCESPLLEDEPIEAHPNDLFFGLDLQAHAVSIHRRIFEELRNRGVRVVFLLYDILPIQRPAFFPPRAILPFHRWFETIARVSHGIICISRTVADEVLSQLDEIDASRSTPLNIGYCHQGADIAASLPTKGVHEGFEAAVSIIKARPTFLMVGTVEPRKGHAQALAAFERLWEAGVEVNLAIVGKQGWTGKDFPEYLREHPQIARHLFWFEGASDEMLLALYSSVAAVLCASEGEGFGLPLIEAAQHRLPIIARDIPVFREVAGEHAYYFSGLSPDHLARAIKSWLELQKRGAAPLSDGMAWQTWKDTARQMKAMLVEDRWYKQKTWEHFQ